MSKQTPVLVAALAVLVSGLAFAAHQITDEEVVKFTDEAAAFAKQVGKEAALKEFNNKAGKFFKHDGELYILAYTFDGTCLALPNNPAMVGKSLIDVKDSDGVYIVRKFIEIAKSPEKKGSLTYRWINPATKKIEKKVTRVIGMGDWLLGAGYYVKE